MKMFLLSAVVLWFGVHNAYVAVMAAKRARDQDTLTLYWKVMLYPTLIVGFIADLLFSLTFGWIMFLAPPKFELFTAKLHYYKNHESGWRTDLAEWYCRNLNIFDPGHC
jgi:hypothetical protein